MSLSHGIKHTNNMATLGTNTLVLTRVNGTKSLTVYKSYNLFPTQTGNVNNNSFHSFSLVSARETDLSLDLVEKKRHKKTKAMFSFNNSP